MSKMSDELSDQDPCFNFFENVFFGFIGLVFDRLFSPKPIFWVEKRREESSGLKTKALKN